METEREDDFREAVVSFGDTFPALKERLRQYRKFSLRHLYSCVFGRNFQGHDAMADASALKQLMRKVFSDNDWGERGILRRHCFTVKDFITALK